MITLHQEMVTILTSDHVINYNQLQLPITITPTLTPHLTQVIISKMEQR